jgi:hypothetical protein
MKDRFCIDSDVSSKIYSIPMWITVFTAPLFGLMSDKIGKRSFLLIVS